ncbi:hypothetical protein AC1031_004143 [Aphanomyces cochlioides]|nr:hypothetical protein AC1031_004143 [Aphanomyces cochlioides]
MEATKFAEKALYVEALGVAMDRGFHQKFMSMHVDKMSNAEAHGTCVFLFWHRRFLTEYENMLRSLDDKFACVTLPYYDYIQDNIAFSRRNGGCTNIESCLPFLQELGGSRNASKMWSQGMTIAQEYTFQNKCIQADPVGHFCENPRDSRACTRCAQIFSSNNIADLTSNLENSPHNTMHGTLDGAMSNIFVSPADPVFYSHHATIDALHAIYYKCRVKGLGLSNRERQTNELSFQGCRTPVGRARRFLDEEPSVKAFFKDIPSEYYALTDTTRLGESSYAYELTELLGDLCAKCEKSGTATEVDQDKSQGNDGQLSNIVVPMSTKGPSQRFLAWRREIQAAGEALNMTDNQIDDQVVRIRTLFYKNCLGGVADFSKDFKTMWNERKSWAKTILDKLRNRKSAIRIKSFPELNEKAAEETSSRRRRRVAEGEKTPSPRQRRRPRSPKLEINLTA